MSTRLLQIGPTEIFGEDAILTSLSGREEISRPFEFFLTIASPKAALKPSQVVGRVLAVRIDRGAKEPRYIHGYISHMWAGDFSSTSQGGTVPSRNYRIRLVPWLWFTTRATRCFIYLPEKAKKSIKDVIDRWLEHVTAYGHVDPVMDCAAAKILANRQVEHCVQYRESDFDFLSRTLERYGIFYYFKHEANKHTMVLSDLASYPNCADSTAEYHDSNARLETEQRIATWEHSYEFVSGKLSHTDFNFTTPSNNLRAEVLKHSTIELDNINGYELYDFPGGYDLLGDGELEAVRRMQEEEARFNAVHGSGTYKAFQPGHSFKLTRHHSCPDEQGHEYLLTSVVHSASQPGPFTASGGESRYSNQFTCIPREVSFRPPRVTPQPLLSSIQTAIVVGPAGEEIYTDKYGRVKVQFHWDRDGKRDEKTSCWIRVTQAHAGPKFGAIDIPRVGEEVVVSFLEGDPDRPLVTGRVYNDEAMPPFDLPAEKTRSGLKSKTYKGGGFNEMSMDDTPGKEQIRIHGQYNLDTLVENDETHTIVNNRTKDVGVDEFNTIGNNQQLKVGVNKTVDVGADHAEKIGANQQVKVGANQSTSVAANQSNTVGSSKTETVGTMSNEMVGIIKTTNVGAAYSIIAGAAMNTAVGFVSAEEVGISKKIVVGSKLEIVVGCSRLVMEAGGKVTIEGTEFLFSASGAVKINGSIIDLN